MADVKHLFRESPREEYHYFNGYLEGYKAAKAKYAATAAEADQQERQIAQTVERSFEQVPQKEPTYYGN